MAEKVIADQWVVWDGPAQQVTDVCDDEAGAVTARDGRLAHRDNAIDKLFVGVISFKEQDDQKKARADREKAAKEAAKDE